MVLVVSVCAVVIMLDLNVTSVLQVITTIPSACVSKRPLSMYWGFPYFCSMEENRFSEMYWYLQLLM